MTDVVSLAPFRALDANGNPVGSAEAYFYRQGTTTPLTVYSDAAGSSAHSSPLVADANGVFAAVFNTSEFNVKVDVKDPTSGASLPGYPIDYALLGKTDTGAASSISFSPTANIPETNVQDAIEKVQANWTSAKTGADDGLVSGTPGTNGQLARWNADGDIEGYTLPTQEIAAWEAGTDTTEAVVSPAKLKAAVVAHSPFKAVTEYDLGLLSATTGTASHGLAAYPSLVMFSLECEFAELAYSVGDRVSFLQIERDNTDGNGLAGWYSTSQVGFAFEPTLLFISKSGALASLTPSRWRVYARVWA